MPELKELLQFHSTEDILAAIEDRFDVMIFASASIKTKGRGSLVTHHKGSNLQVMGLAQVFQQNCWESFKKNSSAES